MQLRDALFNWLQIQIVWEARSSDNAAQETVQFFEGILGQDHKVRDIHKKIDQHEYVVDYVEDGTVKTMRFPREQADQLLQDIMMEPKYNASCDGV
ncbi:hypothetical protein IC620_02835 [Hazenella sp. IB182357]|uniref:Uncharacterized protein n=1 Tax=Polycladospora coralii TaxID=2771432 RepID=A0A926N819_9BACL|nr:hypothetical protein [Polycladospora coralii]MBD1371288.1 hypothetical protein [Polycladospora coralii]MBS7530249.1 hypothetical protein [Polycladospora coralii]